MRSRRTARIGATALAIVSSVATVPMLLAAPRAAAQASGQALAGTFRITQGSCTGGQAAGSTFRMVVPSGGAGGPYVSNNDSTCSDHTYTLLAPGTDGGLITGAYQSEPNPGFDGNGNSLAARITKPAIFYGVAFSTSTNQVDPQTKARVTAPSVAVDNGKLTGDLRAFAASWNHQEFNQGAPKPDGSKPGNTAAPTGTYNADTGAFTLNWASQIQGGPFNNFTGYWHLEGTFAPARGGASAAPAPSRSQGSTGAQPSSDSGTSAASGGDVPLPDPAAGGTATTAPAPGAPAADGSATTTSAPAAGSGSSNDAGTALGDTTNASHQRSKTPLVFATLLILAAAAAVGWYGFVRRRRTAS